MMNITKRLTKTVSILIVSVLMFNFIWITEKVYAEEISSTAIRIIVDGEEVVFSGQKPVVVNGRMLVPVKGVFEKMGYKVKWDGEKQTATLEKQLDGDRLVITAKKDDRYIYMHWDSGTLHFTGADEAPQIINGSFMLPLKAVSKAAGVSTLWDDKTNTAIIKTKSEATGDNTKTWQLSNQPLRRDPNYVSDG